MSEIDNKKEHLLGLVFYLFLAYSSFFLFLMYRYGYSNTDTSWIKELNYSILQISAFLLISLNMIDAVLKKRGKHVVWFDFIHRITSAVLAGILLAVPLFIMMLFKF